MNLFTFYQSLVHYLCKDWIQSVPVENVEGFAQVSIHLCQAYSMGGIWNNFVCSN